MGGCRSILRRRPVNEFLESVSGQKSKGFVVFDVLRVVPLVNRFGELVQGCLVSPGGLLCISPGGQSVKLGRVMM